MNWLDEHMQQYFNWIKEKTTVFQGHNSDWMVIETPLIGAFNDKIALYAKQESQGIILSDDGETLRNLELCGAAIARSPQRKELLGRILANYGVKLVNEELRVHAGAANFPQSKHNLLQAIVEINDLHVLAKHNVTSAFRDDVMGYLDEQQLIYTPQFIARGTTGLEFTFDFQIAGRSEEKILQAFNTLNKQNVTTFLYGLEDIRESREKATHKKLRSLALLNDVEREIDPQFTDALAVKGADLIYWSARHSPENREKLKAA